MSINGQRIFIDNETYEKLKKKSEKLDTSIVEIIRQSVDYAEEHGADVCRGQKDQEELLCGLRQKLIDKFGTLVEAAEHLKTSPSTLSRYFSGKHKPSKSILSRLFEVIR